MVFCYGTWANTNLNCIPFIEIKKLRLRLLSEGILMVFWSGFCPHQLRVKFGGCLVTVFSNYMFASIFPPIFLLFLKSWSLSVLITVDFLVSSQTPPLHPHGRISSLPGVLFHLFKMLYENHFLSWCSGFLSLFSCICPLSLSQRSLLCFCLDRHLLKDIVCLFFFFSSLVL